MARIKYSNADVVKLVSILYVRIYIFLYEGRIVVISYAINNSIPIHFIIKSMNILYFTAIFRYKFLETVCRPLFVGPFIASRACGRPNENILVHTSSVQKHKYTYIIHDITYERYRYK